MHLDRERLFQHDVEEWLKELRKRHKARKKHGKSTGF
jgi:hypothetical protein